MYLRSQGMSPKPALLWTDVHCVERGAPVWALTLVVPVAAHAVMLGEVVSKPKMAFRVSLIHIVDQRRSTTAVAADFDFAVAQLLVFLLSCQEVEVYLRCQDHDVCLEQMEVRYVPAA